MADALPATVRRSRMWRRARGLTLISGTIVVAIGMMVLLGWVTDFPMLMTILPGFIRMKANTAVGFLFCGGGLLLTQYRRSRWNRRLLAAMSMVIIVTGAATLVEYLFHCDLQIDQFLFADRVQPVFPGRMAPITAVDLIIIGLAELCLSFKK